MIKFDQTRSGSLIWVLICVFTLLFGAQSHGGSTLPCKKRVLYKIDNYHPNMNVGAQKQAIQNALAKWQPYFRMPFVETTSGPADITFRWDSNGFYGGGYRMTGFVVGHDQASSSPGLVLLNQNRSWSFSGSSGSVYHLETVLLHGIGRAMGQPTRTYAGPVMYYDYVGLNDQLHLDDIHWSQWGYTYISQCSNYWEYLHGNDGQHFANTSDGNLFLKTWPIDSTDTYISGNFSPDHGNELLMIKPGQRTLLINSFNNSNLSGWAVVNHTSSPFAGVWWGNTSDKHVVGDFDGDGYDEILFANPNGHYKTFRYNSGGWWQQMQSASNGSIYSTDKLYAGDFNGDGIEEVLLIQAATGEHHTMRFNVQTSNWDIISSGSGGSIYWWGISTSDHYAVGDFNGDGKTELLALNPNGWHHTMSFQNNQWVYIEGGSGGSIVYWGISSADRYSVADFNFDNKDELIVINPTNGWSHTMTMSGNQWQFLGGNGGDGDAGYWDFSGNDFIVPDATYDGNLMFLNQNGWWKVIRFQ